MNKQERNRGYVQDMHGNNERIVHVDRHKTIAGQCRTRFVPCCRLEHWIQTAENTFRDQEAVTFRILGALTHAFLGAFKKVAIASLVYITVCTERVKSSGQYRTYFIIESWR